MNKLTILALMAISTNSALAADESFISASNQRQTKGNTVNVERVEAGFQLQGRNETSQGGLKFTAHKVSKGIILTGRKN